MKVLFQCNGKLIRRVNNDQCIFDTEGQDYIKIIAALLRINNMDELDKKSILLATISNEKYTMIISDTAINIDGFIYEDIDVIYTNYISRKEIDKCLVDSVAILGILVSSIQHKVLKGINKRLGEFESLKKQVLEKSEG